MCLQFECGQLPILLANKITGISLTGFERVIAFGLALQCEENVGEVLF